MSDLVAPSSSTMSATSESQIWEDLAWVYYYKWQDALRECDRLSELLENERRQDQFEEEKEYTDGCWD